MYGVGHFDRLSDRKGGVGHFGKLSDQESGAVPVKDRQMDGLRQKKIAASGSLNPDTAQKASRNWGCTDYSALAESQQAFVESQQAATVSVAVLTSSTASTASVSASAFFALLPQAEAATIRATTATDINTFFIINKTKSNFQLCFQGAKVHSFPQLSILFHIFFHPYVTF